jgi:hypothetical protein
MTLDFESDQFLKLLTDALRAGPGSPQWHEAVLRLNAAQNSATQSGVAGVDEYRLLCQAREHLESGKEYRSVRAGPGFTKNVMDAIGAAGMPVKARLSTASVVALVAGALLLVLVTAFAYILLADASSATARRAAIDALASKLLGNAVVSLPMDSASHADWRSIGDLPISFGSTLHLKSTTAPSHGVNAAGFVWTTPMPAGDAFEVEAILRIGHSGEDVLPEIAITDNDDFSPDNAASSHEVVGLVQADQFKVVAPSGRLEATSDLGHGSHWSLTIRLRVDRDNLIAEVDGKRIWAGPNGLDPDKPRYVAVRLVRRGTNSPDRVGFQSVRILTP